MMRCEVRFSGRVQGVGFRYTALEMARANGIYGWVRNCPDGSVLLLAEGEEAAVAALILGLNRHFSSRERSDKRTVVSREFKDFTIEY